ncbi:MAG: SDR family NAD(P)-dependent oxidoreductase [Clostridiales bacterium]|jgi:short-subunit dehydrogenase involved in D-alanine esterification of teichoic acids|nr:SDR family NAD(P)-dependent oxidoreductase [Clostridiales bacterium]
MPQFVVGMPGYCATKAGLYAFSIAQRKQLAPLGIRVIEIIPPMVESELNMVGRIKRNILQSIHKEENLWGCL